MSVKLTNNVYDKLKWIVLIFLPAFISLVATIGQVMDGSWVIPTVTILTAFNTFLGTIIGVSSANYNGGKAEDGYSTNSNE